MDRINAKLGDARVELARATATGLRVEQARAEVTAWEAELLRAEDRLRELLTPDSAVADGELAADGSTVLA